MGKLSIGCLIISSTLLLGCVANIPVGQIRARHPMNNTREISTSVYTDAECVRLSESSDNWLFTAKLLGGGGGAGGLATAIPKKEESRWIVGSLSATTVIVGVAAMWMGERKAAKFQELCQVIDREAAQPVVKEKSTDQPKLDTLMDNPYPEDGGVR